MRATLEQGNDFLAPRPLPGVAFEHNDYVNVVGGEQAGRSGSLVSIEQLATIPFYLVELDSNKDALIPQSCLRVAGA